MEMIYMFKTLINTMKNLDKKIKEIMLKGLNFSLLISILGSFCLLYYISFKSSTFIYYIGLKIIWLSLSFVVSFIACALTMDKIKKDFDF